MNEWQEWYADGELVDDEQDAWILARFYVETRINNGSEVTWTRWDVYTREVIRGIV
jgi:hypothetical protein